MHRDPALLLAPPALQLCCLFVDKLAVTTARNCNKTLIIYLFSILDFRWYCLIRVCWFGLIQTFRVRFWNRPVRPPSFRKSKLFGLRTEVFNAGITFVSLLHHFICRSSAVRVAESECNSGESLPATLFFGVLGNAYPVFNASILFPFSTTTSFGPVPLQLRNPNSIATRF
eukprot:jgi/Botrbrau1/8488/Bobra.0237s0103.1